MRCGRGPDGALPGEQIANNSTDGKQPVTESTMSVPGAGSAQRLSRAYSSEVMKAFAYSGAFLFSVGLGMALAQGVARSAEEKTQPEGKKLMLVWQDEFEGPAGSAPDASKWSYDLGATGWGNQELENYTNARQNSELNGEGQLVITARREASGGYTSARLKTEGKFAFTYGRVEARIRVPKGQGIWPAFWMLGEDIKTVGWPAGGEIDIMENIGKEPQVNHGSVHGPGYSGGSAITSQVKLPRTAALGDDFHVYGLNWSPNRLEFSFDGQVYETVTPAALPPNQKWIFDKPMFLLLNVAVGGQWPGNPDQTTEFPQKMLVDYVRVYRAEQ